MQIYTQYNWEWNFHSQESLSIVTTVSHENETIDAIKSTKCKCKSFVFQFMALYDYNPVEHSPENGPSQQLALTAGDMVVTYGNVRPDGFYHGKVTLQT